MIWLQFVLASMVIVAAAIKLAEYGDAISVRTRIGGLFIGTLLMAGATSLPELLISINSLSQNVPDMAAGNLFGSSMFNMCILAMLDLSQRKVHIMRRVAITHGLTAGLAVLLSAIAVFFLLADVELMFGWVGTGSILLIVGYIIGVRLIRLANPMMEGVQIDIEVDESVPAMKHALPGFMLATLALVLVTPYVVSSGTSIAETTGLSTGIVGTAMLAVVTSLPELVTTIAAVRMGAYDLAVGNLFGSNLFNMFALGITDVVYTKGDFLGDLNVDFALIGLLGLILTCLGLVANLARVERRLFSVEGDALLILVVYLAGMGVLLGRGVSL